MSLTQELIFGVILILLGVEFKAYNIRSKYSIEEFYDADSLRTRIISDKIWRDSNKVVISLLIYFNLTFVFTYFNSTPNPLLLFTITDILLIVIALFVAIRSAICLSSLPKLKPENCKSRTTLNHLILYNEKKSIRINNKHLPMDSITCDTILNAG